MAHRFTLSLFALWVLVCGFRTGVADAADVLTQHNDNARTGTNLDEKELTRSSVRSASFGRLWTLYADGQVVAQPLYVSQLAIDTTRNPNAPRVQGTFNAVIVATMHNTVYAYDADSAKPGLEGRTVPLWATWLGQPRRSDNNIDMFATNDPEWGILSTPVISDDRKTLYVVAWHDDGAQGIRYKLHALDLASGTETRPAAVIIGSSADASQPCNTAGSFNPCRQKQRAALLLSDGVLYVGMGGDGSRGLLVAFDAATLAQKAMWKVTPTGSDGGIWQSGQGPAVDSDGNIYLMTANGTFDADSNGQNYGDSFVRLRLDGQNLTVKDYFTPCNQKFLQTSDLDLGSAGPVLIAGTPPWLVGGGKDGVLYVVSATDMGKYRPPGSGECTNPNVAQQVLAFPPVMHDAITHYGNIHGSPVFWKGPDAEFIYAWGENSPLRGYQFKNGRLQDAPKQSAFQPPLGMPGGMLSLTANGTAPGTGIIWAVVPLDGDANKQRGVHGIVLALNAEDVSQTLWTSEQVPGRDRLGLFAKFTPPTVAGGKLFVATYGDNEPLRGYGGNNRPTQFPRYGVAVYGAIVPPPRPQIVNQDREDVAVVRASTARLTLDTRTCEAADAGSIDCTDALSTATGRPSLFSVILPTSQNVANCALLRVTAAAKTAALQNASGVGFWSSQQTGGNLAADDSGRFVAKAELASVGTGTLKDGSPATLVEFVGVVNCATDGGTDVARLFKPYMQFEGAADGRIYRNWDFASNYLISHDVPGFDRSGDVLR
jgi:hypothetical protein